MTAPRSLNSLRSLRPFRQADRAAVLDRLPAALAVLVGAWVLIAYSVGQWRSMTVPSWDLAIFAELAKAYAHGQAPIVPIKGDDYNLLGDHFHPILVLLGPIWRLFPTPLALLVVQDLLLAVSAWPLTRLATRLTSRSIATALGLFYVLSWGFQGAAQAQFHEIAFAVPMLAWASVAFVERRWKACALWLVPLVLVKEDMGLTLIMAGGAMALRGWQEARAGEPDDAGSGPAKRRSGRFIRAWDELPTVRLGAHLPPDPDDAPAAPAGAAAPAEPTEPAAPAQSPALPDAESPDADSPTAPAAEPASEPAAEAPAGWLAAPVWARRMVAVGVMVPLITCALTASDLPLWAMTEKNYGTPSSRTAAARQVLDAIPEGASVETDLTLLAYLVPKATVSWVGTSGSSGQAKDYVVVDSRSTAWGGRPPKDAAQWATQSRHVAYELVLDVDGFQVAKRID